LTTKVFSRSRVHK